MRLFELAGNVPKSKTAVFTYGRMNPPTIGHEKLLRKVQDVAKQMSADHFVFLSQVQKAPKDPLSWKEKIDIVKKAFPGVNVWEDPAIRTPFEALGELGKDYKEIVMVVGADRVENFKTRMDPYVKEWGIDKFDVVSAGERDPDADGVEGMSASKARELAASGDYKGFAASLPSTVSEVQKKKIFNALRRALGA